MDTNAWNTNPTQPANEAVWQPPTPEPAPATLPTPAAPPPPIPSPTEPAAAWTPPSEPNNPPMPWDIGSPTNPPTPELPSTPPPAPISEKPWSTPAPLANGPAAPAGGDPWAPISAPSAVDTAPDASLNHDIAQDPSPEKTPTNPEVDGGLAEVLQRRIEHHEDAAAQLRAAQTMVNSAEVSPDVKKVVAGLLKLEGGGQHPESQ